MPLQHHQHEIGVKDRRLLGRLQDRAPIAAATSVTISKVAKGGKPWLASAALLTLTGPKGRRAAAHGVAALAASSATVNLLKVVIGRTRPTAPNPHGYMPLGSNPKTSSMPSGHTALAIAFTVAAGAELPSVAAPLTIASAVVAWSRLNSARHFPTDVAVGAATGAATGLCVHFALRRLH